MGHLDELYAKYQSKGLVVLAVTNEGRSLVDTFVEQTGAKHPIVIESGDSLRAYGGSGFPHSALIAADGTIAWMGHPGGITDAKVEELLRDVQLRPELPKKYSSIAWTIEKGRYADALEDLQKELGKDDLAEEARAALEGTVKFIEWKAKMLLEGGNAAAQRGDYYLAVTSWEKAEELFDGHEVAEKAKTSREELLSDKEKKRAFEAGEALEKARLRAGKMKEEQAAAMYRALERKYEGTKAAEEASELARQIEKGLR